MSKEAGGNKLYTHQRFVFMTLDPVHIGAGGYRLGRVDNTIVREPGTNLPKIPGTSLMGVARSYAAMRYGKPDAAGRHKNLEKKDKINCPIVYTFGTASESDEGYAGTISICDARILFFPVHSMAGPVWVSTKEILTEFDFQVNNSDIKEEGISTSLKWDKEKLNLGWLLLSTKNGLKVDPPSGLTETSEWKAIEERIVIVSNKIFSEIANSNLEVRTSVAINPETGAAEDGALFTYEAIPRATWLCCDVIETDYRKNFTAISKQCRIEDKKNGKGEDIRTYYEGEGESLDETWSKPIDVVKAGLRLIEYLGVGGMGTRGFGRMKIINDWVAWK
jgi:CRISPR-associated protein Cmr4